MNQRILSNRWTQKQQQSLYHSKFTSFHQQYQVEFDSKIDSQPTKEYNIIRVLSKLGCNLAKLHFSIQIRYWSYYIKSVSSEKHQVSNTGWSFVAQRMSWACFSWLLFHVISLPLTLSKKKQRKYSPRIGKLYWTLGRSRERFDRLMKLDCNKNCNNLW